MSKRNMFLGLASGKVGDLVFYRDGGEQRTRTRVIPKNPRTAAQMSQRIRIANVSATYRALKSVLADSFSTRPSRMSGYNAFAKYAISMSPFISREQALAATIIPAPYIVSKGTIAPLDYAMGDQDGTPILVLNVSDQAEVPINKALVSTNILKQYPWLQNGDELTFVGLYFEIDDESGVEGVYRATPVVQSLVLDTTDTSPLDGMALIPRSGSLGWGFMDGGTIGAAAVIVSRVDGNGALETSFATLALSEGAADLYGDFRTDNAEFAAIDSYGVGATSILRD